MTTTTEATRSLRLAGLVLAGGRSTRMGQEKCSLKVGSEAMLQRVGRIVQTVVGEWAVAARPGQVLPALPEDVGVLRDSVVDRGPLQGVWEGLRHFTGRAEALLVVPGDAGLLDAGLLRKLVDQFERGDCDIVAPEFGGEVLPLPGVYALNLMPTVARLLDPPRGLKDVMKAARVKSVPLDKVEAGAFSVNTPEEYKELLSRLNERAEGGSAT